jgi:hypothetical protein
MISPYREKKFSNGSLGELFWLCPLLLMASAKCKPALIGNVLGELFENMMGTL